MRPIYQNQKNNLHQIQKYCHQDNLSFVWLQFYQLNCLNILVGSIYFHKQIMNRQK